MNCINTLKQELSAAKNMSTTGLMRRLSLIGIVTIWRISLVCLLMRIIANFLRYTGNLNFINDPVKVSNGAKSRLIANSSSGSTTKLSILYFLLLGSL